MKHSRLEKIAQAGKIFLNNQSNYKIPKIERKSPKIEKNYSLRDRIGSAYGGRFTPRQDEHVYFLPYPARAILLILIIILMSCSDKIVNEYYNLNEEKVLDSKLFGEWQKQASSQTATFSDTGICSIDGVSGEYNTDFNKIHLIVIAEYYNIIDTSKFIYYYSVSDNYLRLCQIDVNYMDVWVCGSYTR